VRLSLSLGVCVFRQAQNGEWEKEREGERETAAERELKKVKSTETMSSGRRALTLFESKWGDSSTISSLSFSLSPPFRLICHSDILLFHPDSGIHPSIHPSIRVSDSTIFSALFLYLLSFSF
jgi:hypothetical protein